MKMIDFMRWCIKFDHEGYNVIGTAKEIVIFGQRGKLVIPYGEIYNFSFSRLKSEVRALHPMPHKGNGKNEQTGSEEVRDAGGAGGENRGNSGADGEGGGGAAPPEPARRREGQCGAGRSEDGGEAGEKPL